MFIYFGELGDATHSQLLQERAIEGNKWGNVGTGFGPKTMGPNNLSIQ